MFKANLMARVLICILAILLILSFFQSSLADDLVPPPATTPYPGQVWPCNPRMGEYQCSLYHVYLPLVLK